MVDIFKALGDDNRMRIINLLIKEELCVCEIETVLNITQSNVSRHLIKLKSAGIISSCKEAQWVHYKVSQDFRERHGLLLQHIENELRKEQQWRHDSKKLEKYKNSPYNCEHIRQNKQAVIEYLEREREGVLV
ncbi:metalloregulator ArsR/SmtB family transcription factor [Petroclostridium sp. X23]|uniref:ArsR/SmtB family transcription factor n=1 Tax=Petroclostridium sp. X23 TaxID=3045146 RepID=UPI0024AD9F06|nr:metalloregulator ArsR/SmtB family transcription factor [Petroclostridium sp. X23]WHH61673.1 metalloregulator ArsR/SmtB family transcription factor [Petroclostridium sp. X23]